MLAALHFCPFINLVTELHHFTEVSNLLSFTKCQMMNTLHCLVPTFAITEPNRRIFIFSFSPQRKVWIAMKCCKMLKDTLYHHFSAFSSMSIYYRTEHSWERKHILDTPLKKTWMWILNIRSIWPKISEETASNWPATVQNQTPKQKHSFSDTVP